MSGRYRGRESARCALCWAAHVPHSPGACLGLEVHHVTYTPEQTIWLCRSCHVALHNGRFPDVEESLLAPLQLVRARSTRARMSRAGAA